MNTKQLLKAAFGHDIKDYSKVKVVSDETRGLTIYKFNNILVIGFQGTKGAIWPPSNDWIKNLFVWPKKTTIGTDKYFAHSGFVDEYDTLRDEIFEAIRINQPNMIYISGFSQGGAHATLCFRDLSYNFSNIKINAVAFASPRVYTEKGSWEFNAHLNKMNYIHNFDRVTVHGDPVPHLPPWFLGYTNVGKCKMIGKWKLFPDEKVHDFDVYYDSI